MCLGIFVCMYIVWYRCPLTCVRSSQPGLCTCVCVCVSCVFVVYVCVSCVYVCVHVYVCACVYVYVYVCACTVNREIFVVKIFSYGLLAYEN